MSAADAADINAIATRLCELDYGERGAVLSSLAITHTELVAEALAALAATVDAGEVMAAGESFPGRPGYVTGQCGHAVAGSEWRAGFRVCERCPSPKAATP